MFLFVFVSRQTKKTIFCDLCGSTLLTTLSPWFELPHHPEPVDGSKGASAVIFLKEFLSVSICVNLRLIAFDALRFALFKYLWEGAR